MPFAGSCPYYRQQTVECFLADPMALDRYPIRAVARAFDSRPIPKRPAYGRTGTSVRYRTDSADGLPHTRGDRPGVDA